MNDNLKKELDIEEVTQEVEVIDWDAEAEKAKHEAFLEKIRQRKAAIQSKLAQAS